MPRSRPASLVRLAAFFVVAAYAASAGNATWAQPTTRRLTTVDALRQFPAYFHLQPVLVRGELAAAGERVMLRADEHEIRVLLNPSTGSGQALSESGPVDVRGQFVDVGRLEPTDPRVSTLNLGPRDDDRWPKPGEELILNVAGVISAQTATTPSVRALALEPWKFAGRSVTLVGQFRGRNLFGDLPAAPGKSRYDFVLKASDASVWVTGLRPRGKGVDLNVEARVDTGKWIEVMGAVAHDEGLVTIAATRIQAAAEPELTTPAEAPVKVTIPQLPVTVVFNSPTEGETDVALTSPVRIQFSRSLDPATLKGRLRVSYLGAESVERGEPQPPGIELKTSYDPGSRALVVAFPKGLERFRTVKVELLEGIKGFDGSEVTPWTLTFSLGG